MKIDLYDCWIRIWIKNWITRVLFSPFDKEDVKCKVGKKKKKTFFIEKNRCHWRLFIKIQINPVDATHRCENVIILLHVTVHAPNWKVFLEFFLITRIKSLFFSPALTLWYPISTEIRLLTRIWTELMMNFRFINFHWNLKKSYYDIWK